MYRNNLRNVTTGELLRLYGDVLTELQRRELIRSANNPVADYSEFLVARALNLKLVTKSKKGYDGIDQAGARYEIKGRRLTAQNQSRQLGFIRGLKERHFDYLAGVLFSEDFSVLRACVLPAEIVDRFAKFVPLVNGWRLILRDDIWNYANVRDITAGLRSVAENL